MLRPILLRPVLLVSLLALLVPPVSAHNAASSRVDDSAPRPTYRAGIEFGTPVQMKPIDPVQPSGLGEPIVKVDSEGTIYFSATCCVGRPSPAWYSKDDGKTFAPLRTPAGAREMTVGIEADMALDDADGLAFIDLAYLSLIFTRWSGGGDVWEFSTLSNALAGEPIDRPWLTYTHGVFYLVVKHWQHTAVYESRDGGQTWLPSLVTLPELRYFPGHISADRKSGDVYLFGRCSDASGPLDPAPLSTDLCTAHNRGEGWQEVGPVLDTPRGNFGAWFMPTAVDAAGNVYAAYTSANNEGCDVYLGVSTDRGESWRQYRVNPEQGCATYPWIEAGDDGRVALSWYYNPSQRSQNEVPEGSEWRVQAAVVTDATSDEPQVTSGTLDRVVHEGPLRRFLWDFQQVAVGPDGRFHVAFTEDVGACSGAAGVAGYTPKCVSYIGQTAGPRALLHAGDKTSLTHLTQQRAGAASTRATGKVSFGRASAVRVASDGAGDGAPGVDLLSASITRTTAISDELVFEVSADLIPGVESPVTVTWPLRVGDDSYELRMRPHPRSFELCDDDGLCSPVRGDANAGSDRIVARVPLEQLGKPGTRITPGAVTAGDPAVDSMASTREFVIPKAHIRVSLRDRTGELLARKRAVMSDDATAFNADFPTPLQAAFVEARACYAGRCRRDLVPIGR